MMERKSCHCLLSRPTGDGKTYAMVASALASEGVSLFHLPNQTLIAGFMTGSLRKFDVDVWNLDTTKTKKEADELVEFLKALNRKEDRNKGRCSIIVCAPRSLGGEEGAREIQLVRNFSATRTKWNSEACCRRRSPSRGITTRLRLPTEQIQPNFKKLHREAAFSKKLPHRRKAEIRRALFHLL